MGEVILTMKDIDKVYIDESSYRYLSERFRIHYL